MSAIKGISPNSLVKAAVSDVVGLLDKEYMVTNIIEAINVINAIDLAVHCVLMTPKFASLTEFEADVVHELAFDRCLLKIA